jgi:lipopolysaccharide/colanic/teichoic acid biosynthesis glycosyltransferase
MTSQTLYHSTAESRLLAKTVTADKRRSNSKFFYVGNHQNEIQFFSSFFIKGGYCNSLNEAQHLLEKALVQKSGIPDAIILDVPLNQVELALFFNWFSSKTQFAKIPVIYSDTYLNAAQITYLRHIDMVDEVTSINSWEVNYAGKIEFLRKLKHHQTKMRVSRNENTVITNKQEGKQLLFKRIFDVVIASLVILGCLPVFLLIAIAIKLESKGPVFYTSLRAGKGFKVFKFFKFRTMEVDADQKIESFEHLNQYGSNENGVKFLKICNDPRITKVGCFLRNTSLDELPQLFNVLLGDMSLVGNRPLPIYEASTLTTDEYAERFMAPAGITGLWQVTKRSGSDMSAEERINLDISYARKYSFLFDMWIIAQTPAALFQKTNV